jgi:phospholipase/lecithinase/hemolysin
MTSYFKAVQKAHDNGLKTHLFINVPAEDRSPSIVGDPTKSATMKTHLTQFNSILANHVMAFKAANADATVMTFDSNAWFNMVLDSPAEFGFTNTTGFCTCADPAGFFWYNTGHPTERVHLLLADAIETELRNATSR